MVEAIIMAKIDAGEDKEVLDKVKAIKGVSHACATYGIYDMVIWVEFQSIQALDKFVFNELRLIPSVRETITLICSCFVT